MRTLISLALLVLSLTGCVKDEAVPPTPTPALEYRTLKARVVTTGSYRLRVITVLGTRTGFTMDAPVNGGTSVEFSAPVGSTVMTFAEDNTTTATLDLLRDEEVVASGVAEGNDLSLTYTVP